MKNIFLLVGHYESDPYEPTGTDIYGAFSSVEEAAKAFTNFFDKQRQTFLDYFKEWDTKNYWKDYPALPDNYKPKFIQDVLNIFNTFEFSNDPVADYNNLRELISDFDETNRQLFLELEKNNKRYWDLACSLHLFDIKNYFFKVDELEILTLAENKLVHESQG